LPNVCSPADSCIGALGASTTESDADAGLSLLLLVSAVAASDKRLLLVVTTLGRVLVRLVAPLAVPMRFKSARTLSKAIFFDLSSFFGRLWRGCSIWFFVSLLHHWHLVVVVFRIYRLDCHRSSIDGHNHRFLVCLLMRRLEIACSNWHCARPHLTHWLTSHVIIRCRSNSSSRRCLLLFFRKNGLQTRLD
jgi:hypothetical protein